MVEMCIYKRRIMYIMYSLLFVRYGSRTNETIHNITEYN